MKNRLVIVIISLMLFVSFTVYGQNVVIVVIDGVRYSESFGAKQKYMPKIWKNLRPKGTIWTNFRNEKLTSTDPGHASIITGTWQEIDNKGVYGPTKPTIFEYFRKATGASETEVAIIVGKQKLNILAYSNDTTYGEKYKASIFIEKDDLAVVKKLFSVLQQNKPRIVLVNLPNTDRSGHSGIWKQYVSAIKTADSLTYVIWQKLQSIPFYKNNTTLFVTNDHGRHDDNHGGFEDHGDACEGCEHIMLLAIGKKFSANRVITNLHTQCDIVPTIGELLAIPTPLTTGTSLLRDMVNTAP